ncbi:MAG: hypothetical protein AAF311_00705 [Pseudomonadota bacterium]
MTDWADLAFRLKGVLALGLGIAFLAVPGAVDDLIGADLGVDALVILRVVGTLVAAIGFHLLVSSGARQLSRPVSFVYLAGDVLAAIFLAGGAGSGALGAGGYLLSAVFGASALIYFVSLLVPSRPGSV